MQWTNLETARNVAIVLACVAAATPVVARAQNAAATPLPPVVKANPDSDIDFVGVLGGAIDKTALAASIGARLRFAEDWHVGLHAEYNPWGSVTGYKLRSGSANFFASLDYRWTKGSRITLTSIGYLGASMLLFDLYGVPKGSIGPYLGITPLAAEVRLSRRLSLLVESTRLAFPIPQISGVPFGYRQYRFNVGIIVALD